jgi:hypothetical protein
MQMRRRRICCIQVKRTHKEEADQETKENLSEDENNNGKLDTTATK